MSTHLKIIFATLLTIIIAHNSALADQQKQVILVGGELYLKMAHRIEGALLSEPTPRPHVQRIDPAHIDRLMQSNTTDLIVTLGIENTETVLSQNVNTPILALLIPKYAYVDFKKRYPKAAMTALFLDQPIGRQLNLIQQLMLPSEKTTPIGVILGPDSKTSQDVLQQEALERNLSLQIIHVHNDEPAINALGLVLTGTSFLLALPDDHVYNQKTARGILLATFRKKIPLISHTYTYVQKGALASVYSRPEQIAEEATQFIMALLSVNKETLLPPRYPRLFSIVINHQAARSLERPIDSASMIQSAMEEMERQSPEGGYCRISEQPLSLNKG